MRGVLTSLSFWVGLLAAALAWGAYLLAFGAVGVVADTRPAGTVLAAISVALLGPGLGRGGDRAPSGPRRATAALALVAAVLVGGRLLWDLLLADRAEPVRFSSGSISLAGTLYLPRAGASPRPAVVITHGAGKQTRGEGAFYARLFARRGIAALAYDKRGSGQSSGDEATATYEDLAADAGAALRYLAGRPEIDRRRIGMWGVSEGAWVIPIVAASESVAFVIVASATADSPAEQVKHEVGERVRRAGYGDALATRATELYSRVSEFERTGRDREGLGAELRQASRQGWFESAGYLPDTLPTFEQLQRRHWYAAWRADMDFDAPAYWRRVRCPVLVLLGGSDPKLDAVKSESAIRDALRAGGNPDVTVLVFPRAGHGIVEWWLPRHMPPPRFPKSYLPSTVDWTLARVSPNARGSS